MKTLSGVSWLDGCPESLASHHQSLLSEAHQMAVHHPDDRMDPCLLIISLIGFVPSIYHFPYRNSKCININCIIVSIFKQFRSHVCECTNSEECLLWWSTYPCVTPSIVMWWANPKSAIFISSRDFPRSKLGNWNCFLNNCTLKV